jgi:hypothetical protein
MTRRFAGFVLVALGAWLVAGPAAAADKESVQKKLDKKITLEKGIAANTTLQEALEFLADKFDVTLVVDSKSFNAVGVQLVAEQPVKLDKQKDVPLGKVLQKILDQVEGTYRIDKDRVMIVAKKPKE